jgi:hypothetical protein
MRWTGHVGVYRVLVGKSEEKWPLRRPREDNIKMNLQEVECRGMDWIELAQHRDRWQALLNMVMNLRVPKNAGNFLPSCKPVRFSSSLFHGVSKCFLVQVVFTQEPDVVLYLVFSFFFILRMQYRLFNCYSYCYAILFAVCIAFNYWVVKVLKV